MKKINLFDFYHGLDVDGSDLAIFAADYGRERCPCPSILPSSQAITQMQMAVTWPLLLITMLFSYNPDKQVAVLIFRKKE